MSALRSYTAASKSNMLARKPIADLAITTCNHVREIIEG